MIPQRIVLQGFLCYRQRQELFFDDAPLWMLAGLNGSGKSAVFDAVTYALFGGHRGGKQNAEDLVNKECDGLIVEFDFRLADNTYRIKRTLRKAGRSTRQLLQSVTADGQKTWAPVENTGGARGFDEWIKDHLGLNYETFTSSVLLMQGQADKLLNADGNERRKVLAGIVDLERYEKLHRRVDELRKKQRDRAEGLQQKLGVTPEVAEDEWSSADGAIGTAQEQLDQARRDVERWQRLEVQAERWAELRGQLAEASRQWERARGLLAGAATIENDWARLRELKEVLPHLRTAVEQKQRQDESGRSAATASKDREALTTRLQELSCAEEQTRQKRDQVRQTIARDQQREQDLAGRLQELAALLRQVELVEQQQRTVARAEEELARLAFDPAALVLVRNECDRLGEVARVLPVLHRLHRKREDLRQAHDQHRQALEEEKTVTEQGKQLAVQVKEAEAALEKARTERRTAAEHAAKAKARLDDATKELKELGTLSGESRCRRCGQELTPNHLAEEKTRREKARTAAETAYRSTEQVSKKATEVEEESATRHKQFQEQYEQARDHYRDVKARARAAEQAVQQNVHECGESFAELPEMEQQRVAAADDWLATTYPTTADLAGLRGQADGWEPARKRLKQAESHREKWTRLVAERDSAVKTLQVQQTGLPADGAVVRRDHAQRQAEDADLRKALKAQRSQLREDEQGLEHLARDREGVRQQLAECERKLEAERVRQEGCRDALDRARAVLPAAWQKEIEALSALQLQAWQQEVIVLEKKGAEGKAHDLEQARLHLEPLRREVAHREADLNAVPEEARSEPEFVRQRLRAAKQNQTRGEEELGRVRSVRQSLADRRDRRHQLHEEFLNADREHHRCKLLAELLGPKRLQLHLVRRAEAGIVEFANEVLDRLSAGQLYLKLRRGEGDESVDKALELEAYVRSAGDAPVSVPFLSGSQRFRVAVSLALGIGRFASRSHRPIESVIIDEGFGCLDRQGRQVMIQELQNLREHMRCILLVSHQEEFADAFPNGYRFELTNGSTEVTRFQR